VELYLHSPNTPSWSGAQLKRKHKDNFTFTFTFLNELQNGNSRHLQLKNKMIHTFNIYKRTVLYHKQNCGLR